MVSRAAIGNHMRTTVFALDFSREAGAWRMTSSARNGSNWVNGWCEVQRICPASFCGNEMLHARFRGEEPVK